MKVIPLDRDVPEIWTLGPAVDALKKGELVMFPTDSIYAIGCDPFDVSAVGRLYAAKGMERGHRCGVICPDVKQVAQVASVISNDAFRFIRRHLPGPYTLIFKANRDLPNQALGKRKEIGVRIPNHPVSLALVEDWGGPLLVTSVPGWEGGLEIDPVELAQRLQVRPSVVLDQGPLIAEPSTVIDFTLDPPEVVREGKGPVDDL